SSGGEAFFYHTLDVVKGCLNLAVFALTISLFSPLPFLVALIVGALLYFTLQYVRKAEDGSRDFFGQLAMRRSYLERTAYEIANGKDLRIYQMSSWF
ncbi:hypothetical protein, partial [Streptomyces sp. P17]|uniref:hypothetical protein n=1 Tax=Streptomyces sp. P17 TaxID=3074716 RepID=UPI0028F402CE